MKPVNRSSIVAGLLGYAAAAGDGGQRADAENGK